MLWSRNTMVSGNENENIFKEITIIVLDVALVRKGEMMVVKEFSKL